MVDLDPAIWENKTLGSANNLPFLDEVSAQIVENRDAKSEGRKPRSREWRNRFSTPSLVGHLYTYDGVKVTDPADYETELEWLTEEQAQKIDREDKHQKEVATKEAQEAEDAKPTTPNRRTSSSKK